MTSFAIARYRRDGTLDPSFGNGGKVTVVMNNSQGISATMAVHLAGDDSITVCGNLSSEGIGIVQLRADGRVVDTPGTQAGSQADFMPGQTRPILRKIFITQSTLLASTGVSPISSTPGALLPNTITNPPDAVPTPRILALGDVGDTPVQRLLALARYNTNAQRDTTFSGDGQLVFGFNARTIEVTAGAFNRRTHRIVAIATRRDANIRGLSLARFLSNGTPDPEFGQDGEVEMFFLQGGEQWIVESFDAVFQAGEIIIAGQGILPSANSRGEMVVMRVNEDGTRDDEFGIPTEANGQPSRVGLQFVDFGAEDSEARSVRIDPRGRIITAGKAGLKFALARLLRNGMLDTTFSSDGKATTAFSQGESAANVVRIDSATTERIIAAGSSGRQFALARYMDNGTLDGSFGTGGKVRTVFDNENRSSNILDIAIDSQQRIVAVGTVSDSGPVE